MWCSLKQILTIWNNEKVVAVREKVKAFFEPVAKKLAPVWEKVKPVFAKIGEKLAPVWKKVKELLAKAWGALKKIPKVMHNAMEKRAAAKFEKNKEAVEKTLAAKNEVSENETEN